ncbi:MAG TPA: DivIVA domain-containing protein, partial [Thermoleophilia bacterium]|nr:DivIVA domain-containing protein [Thermoleophilia bacterium]
MKLTPLDIRHKEFKRGMRGYADVEVDEFLDEVADEYERLFKENIDLGERVETLEGQVGGYKRIEETLQKTLVSAQASAEELKLNATKEAQLILHEAELKARQLVNDSYTEKQAIDQSMAKLKSADQDFRFRFKQLLDGYLKQIEETPAVAEEAAGAGSAHEEFARHAEAIKAAIEREGRSATPPASAGARPASTAAEVTRGADNVDAPAVEEDDGLAPVFPASPEEAVLPSEPGPGAVSGEHKKDRILFGESDDILSDVDSGVNEN